MKKHLLPLCGALMLWFAAAFPMSSHASSAIETVKLADEVKRAGVIAIVRPVGEPKAVTIAIGKDAKGRKAPDFTRRDRVFDVVEVLIRRSGGKTGKRIVVAPAQWSMRLSVHRRYYLEGTRKIPIYRRLELGKVMATGKLPIAPGGEAIALLHTNDKPGYEFAVEGGLIPMALRNDVRRILEGRAARGGDEGPGKLAGKQSPLQPIAWLAGTWRGKTPWGEVQETWSQARGGTMLGVNRTISRGKTVGHEYLRIVAESDGKGAKAGTRLVYIAQPGGKSPGTRFVHQHLRKGLHAFVNRGHDFPQRITYERIKGKRLRIFVTGDGRPLRFVLKRIR